MGFFGIGKKNKVLDLTEGYKRKVAEAAQIKKAQEAKNQSPFSFFDSTAMQSQSSSSSDAVDLSDTAEERKKRLAKRIAEMTDKMEDLSNQIYHLQQRIEVMERKNDINRI